MSKERITITGVQALGCHGVLNFEQSSPQPFVVDIAIEANLARACTSDNIDDTVSYAEVAQRVKSIIEIEHYSLIERLAARLADEILQFPLAERVQVTVHKPRAPIPVAFNDVSVTVERER